MGADIVIMGISSPTYEQYPGVLIMICMYKDMPSKVAIHDLQ